MFIYISLFVLSLEPALQTQPKKKKWYDFKIKHKGKHEHLRTSCAHR